MTKILKCFFMFFAFCVFSSFNTYAAYTHRLVDLGLQESDKSEAVAINDNGQVAGTYWMFGKKHYFLWTEADGIMLIDLPEAANITVLNNSGKIAGNYQDSSGNDRGFIWESSLGFKDIGTLGGGFTRVYDMNDLGQIVGESESSNVSLVDGRREQHAFLWQSGSMIELSALTGDLGVLGDRSLAASINNSGQIIGTSNYLMAHKRTFLRGVNRAVVWKNGVIEELDRTLDLESHAVAISVNNKGIATFIHKKYGYFAVNLNEKSKILFSVNNFNEPFAVTDNTDIFVIHNRTLNGYAVYIGFLKSDNSRGTRFAGDFYDDVYFPMAFANPECWKPNSFCGTDFNNNRLVVGSAANIYGERHGVLLVPVIE